MPKFAANLSMLFTELPFLDRFQAAADAGFKGVEFLFPYDYDIEDIASRLARHGLTLALFNLPAGQWDAGERGISIFSAASDEFYAGVARAITFAQALGCRQLHCLAGIAPTGADHRLLRKTYVEHLKFAADALAKHDLSLLIEPINTRDIPRYFLDSTAKARDIIESVDAHNLRLQYDVYHMQIMEGDLAPTLARTMNIIGHIQVADTPGRHEPGTGEINYPFLFEHLDQLGYNGWVGLEYRPKSSTADSLRWINGLASRQI